MGINKIDIAKEFRANPTRSENIMWNVFKNRNFLGIKFKRQHVIKGFIVDFYCPQLKLVIELDGEIHKYQIREDAERQKIIEENKIIFYRIKSKDVENDLKFVLEKLQQFVKNTFNIIN